MAVSYSGSQDLDAQSHDTAYNSFEIVNFGCRLNHYESEKIKSYLDNKNSAADNANSRQNHNGKIVIFNSCAVTKESERQLQQSIRKYHRNNPDAKLIITGCAAQINADKYSKMPEVSLVVGNEYKENANFWQSNIHEHITNNEASNNHQDKIVVTDIMALKETAGHIITNGNIDTQNSLKNNRQQNITRSRAFVQVQNGCNHRCTFCIIPYGRGNSRSVPAGAIIQEIAQLVSEQGYNEIVLTGVDLTSYGEDLPGRPTLGMLCRRILKLIPNLPRLRLSSIDAAELDDDLWHLLADEPRFMPYLHISAQSGDDLILKRMKRRHSRTQIIEMCERARGLRPDIAFGADIIAGFPTETDEMFQNSVKLIKEAGLSYLHVFPFSAREGTPAAKMPQLPVAIRKERAAILRENGKEQLSKLYQSQIGKTTKIIVENNIEQGKITGKAENFADVIIDNNPKLPQYVEPGKIYNICITNAYDKFATGEIIN